MALINTIIPPQSFEIVRDRIGEILAMEVENQVILGLDYDLDADVWVNRYVPFDKTEIPAIDVTVDSGTYGGQTVKQADGTYQFNVDVYTQAKSRDDDPGDQRAVSKLHRLMGVVRAILENPKYKTLGFDDTPPGFIMSKHVTNVGFAAPNPDDGTSTVMGRLLVTVKVPEYTELINPNLIVGWETSVKLSLTDKGYKFIGETAP